jgi:predicted nucleotidyltransferase
MKRDQALAILREHDSDLKRLGVESLALFGSVARDEAAQDSDVDLLLDMKAPASFDGYMAVKLFLEGLLNCRVDLVMRKAVTGRNRPAIERDAVRVA